MPEQTDVPTSDLRYLRAAQVRYPSGTLGGLRVCAENDRTLGTLDGVLVEPAHRRVRYFVVEQPGLLSSRRYLLPAELPAVVDSRAGQLRVVASADELIRFETRSVRSFSDEDLVTALVAPAA